MLVICDGRGKDLEELMLNIQDSMDRLTLVRYTLFVFEKATIYEAVTEGEAKLPVNIFDIVILMLGLNDLITRHLNGHISPKL